MNQRKVISWLVILSQLLVSCVHNTPTVPTSVDTTDYTVPHKISRKPSSTLDGTPWTDWYNKKTEAAGLFALGNVRDTLLNENLKDPHEKEAKVKGPKNFNFDFYDKKVDCSKLNTNFRQADGTCDDLSMPMAGSAGVAFGRNIAPDKIDRKAQENLMIPDPALVSKVFFTRDIDKSSNEPVVKEVPFLNMLAASWIQFMVHDWLSHGPNEVKDPYQAPTNEGVRTVDRTKENPYSSGLYSKDFDKILINEVTPWWDGSQIYGSSAAEQKAVRGPWRGLLNMDEPIKGRQILPEDKYFNAIDNRQNRGKEITGFRDNWWLGLSMLHTLFVKEHNYIADQLLKYCTRYSSKDKNFTWTCENAKGKIFDEVGLDEQIFQTARLINAAIMAKIHTVEWTPAILKNPTLNRAMHTNWFGLANVSTWLRASTGIPDLNKILKTDYIIGGIVGQKTNNYGIPYSMTEEFTSVYRLHSLLPEHLNMKHLGNSAVTPLPMIDTRSEKSYDIMASTDLKDLYYSFGTQLPGQLVLNNYPKFMQDLQIAGHGSLDMAMIDIMRDRERGVPRYNQFREAIGLLPIKQYKDFFPIDKPEKPLDARQMAILKKFYAVYGCLEKDEQNNCIKDNVDMIDLLVGTSAEEVRPTSFGFGETMFQIFILMASRRLMADRFYTTDYRPGVYTSWGINHINGESTFKQVILRHMPELASKIRDRDDKGEQVSAFYPWKN